MIFLDKSKNCHINAFQFIKLYFNIHGKFFKPSYQLNLSHTLICALIIILVLSYSCVCILGRHSILRVSCAKNYSIYVVNLVNDYPLSLSILDYVYVQKCKILWFCNLWTGMLPQDNIHSCITRSMSE